MTRDYSIIFIFILTGLIAAYASAGERNGILGGGGIGVSPYNRTSSTYGYAVGGLSAHPTFNYCLGYGLNQTQVIALLGNIITRGSDPVVLGFVGPAYIHYRKASPNAVFFVVGLGLQYSGWERQTFLDFGPPHLKFGPGLRLGCGYVPASHLQFDLSLGVGRTTYQEANLTHTSLTLNVTFLAY